MQASNAPLKFNIPWANSGTKNTIPQASQIGITPGAASLTDGFPPLTLTPISEGGVPPDGADTNGILNEVTAAIIWGVQAGAAFVWDSAFSAAIGGYPAGGQVTRADKSGKWISTVDNNTTNPDTGGAGWLPAEGLSTLGGTMSGLLTFATAAADTAAITGFKANANGASRIDPNGSSFTVPVSSTDIAGRRALFHMDRTDNASTIWSVNADGSQNVLALTAAGTVAAATITATGIVTGSGGVFGGTTVPALSPTASAVTLRNETGAGPSITHSGGVGSVANGRIWQTLASGPNLIFRVVNDALTAASNWLQVSGTGGGAVNVAFQVLPTVPTATAGDSSTNVANTSWISAAFAKLSGAIFTGTISAPTVTANVATATVPSVATTQATLLTGPGGATPRLVLVNAANATAARIFDIVNTGNVMALRIVNDAYSAAQALITLGGTYSAGTVTFNVAPTTPTPTASDNSGTVVNSAWVTASFAKILSPAFQGTPTTTTPAAADNSTRIPTTNWVAATYAPLVGPVFTNPQTNSTPGHGDNSARIPNTSWVITYFAPLSSPNFTGSPTTGTPLQGDNSGLIPNTNWVTTYFTKQQGGTLNGGQSFTTPPQNDATATIPNTFWVDEFFTKKSDFPFLATANGYIKLPNGFILNWGSVTSGAASSVTAAFPLAFPNTCFITMATDASSSAPGAFHGTVNNGNASITIYGASAAGVAATGWKAAWLAIGN